MTEQFQFCFCLTDAINRSKLSRGEKMSRHILYILRLECEMKIVRINTNVCKNVDKNAKWKNNLNKWDNKCVLKCEMVKQDEEMYKQMSIQM